MKFSTFEILIGPKDDKPSARVCQILLWIFSSLLTLITRIIFLFFCLHSSNSIVVTLYPSTKIFLNNTCSFITEVSGSSHYNLYNKSRQADLYFGENNLLMSDEYDYVKNHYYCGDVTKFLNTSWIPLLTWFTIIILPQLLLSTIAFIITFKTKSFKLLLLHPGFTLTSIISHQNIGPLSWSQNSPGLIHSKILSYLNILLTFLGMCFIIHLTTAPFGGGDGRQLRFVLPLVICVPMFIFSGIFAIVFMHCCCCNIRRRVFNPEDPKKVYILGIGETLAEQEENNFKIKK